MKYKITSETKVFFGKTLFRIKATIAFGAIMKDEFGGFVESEENLSQSGNAWVCGNACVYGNARVCGDARVYGDARVSGDASVCGNACVYGNAWVCGDASVYGNARVCGDACVYGDASVSGDARVCGETVIEASRHVESPICISASRYFVGWSGIPGKIRSGCILRPITWWENHVRRCAEEHGYTEDQQIEYELLIDLVIQWMKSKDVDQEVK